MPNRSKVVTTRRRQSPRLALTHISPIAEDPAEDGLQEQQGWEGNQENQEQEAPGNIPNFTTPTDEVIGEQLDQQLQDQLDEERTEEEGTGSEDQEDQDVDKEESRGETSSNWRTPLDEAPNQRGGQAPGLERLQSPG